MFMKLVLGIIVVFIIIEIVILRDLEKPDSKVRKKLNWLEYKLEKKKYKAYAMESYTLAWKRIEDIGKQKLATTVCFHQNEMLVVSKYINKNNKKYRKLYIIDGENIQIVYVDACSVMNLKKI